MNERTNKINESYFTNWFQDTIAQWCGVIVGHSL